MIKIKKSAIGMFVLAFTTLLLITGSPVQIANNLVENNGHLYIKNIGQEAYAADDDGGGDGDDSGGDSKEDMVKENCEKSDGIWDSEVYECAFQTVIGDDEHNNRAADQEAFEHNLADDNLYKHYIDTRRETQKDEEYSDWEYKYEDVDSPPVESDKEKKSVSDVIKEIAKNIEPRNEVNQGPRQEPIEEYNKESDEQKEEEEQDEPEEEDEQEEEEEDNGDSESEE